MTTPARYQSSDLVSTRSPGGGSRRDLVRIERQTIVRTARVLSEELVATEKLRSVDRLAREAASGQAMLRQWVNTLAGADLILADELRIFTETARLGKAEVIADTIDSFARESRR